MAKQDWADKRDARKQSTESKRKLTQHNTETADWAAADAALLQEAIAVVAWQGGALRFGYTRDGGAYCIGILGDGEPYNEYCKPSEDINEYLRALVVRWRD